MSDLGDLLRRARAYKGVTLRDAERSTRISRRYLAALEAHDFDQLPPLAYSRGIVRNYAQYLGLDPAVVLNLYEATANQTEQPEPLEVVPAVQPIQIQGNWAPNFAIITFMLVISAVIFTWVYSAYLQPSEPADATSLNQPAPTGERESLLDLVAASPPLTATPQANDGATTETTDSTLAASQDDSTGTNEAPEGTAGEPSATPSVEPTGESSTAGETASATSEEDEDDESDLDIPGVESIPDGVTLPADSHVFVIYAEEEVWVEITLDADEYPIFSGVLSEGETSELYIARSATVTSGNAAFVRVFVDGEDMGTLGEPWDAVVTYP